MTATTIARPGRNEPCHCGSGRKYKQCCLEKDNAEASAARKAAAEAVEQSSAVSETPDATTVKTVRSPKPRGVIAGADFFTIEVWTWRGLITYYTVFVTDLASRRVHVLGSTPHPSELFMGQVVRIMTAADDGALSGH